VYKSKKYACVCVLASVTSNLAGESRGLVVSTPASHAGGREFKPR